MKDLTSLPLRCCNPPIITTKYTLENAVLQKKEKKTPSLVTQLFVGPHSSAYSSSRSRSSARSFPFAFCLLVFPTMRAESSMQ